jgi:hypothetical protein
MAFKTEKISTDMPLQGFRLQKSGNPHEYWAAVCKKDNFQWITVELGSIWGITKIKLNQLPMLM